MFFYQCIIHSFELISSDGSFVKFSGNLDGELIIGTIGILRNVKKHEIWCTNDLSAFENIVDIFGGEAVLLWEHKMRN